MNIRLIKTDKNIIKVYPSGSRIIELSSKKVGESTFLSLASFDPSKNTVSEIVSSVPEDKWVPVQNCIFGSQDHYHAILNEDGSEQIIRLFKYSAADGSLICVYTYSRAYEEPDRSDDLRFRIFVITEDQIIVQTEKKKEQDTEKLMGNIEFFQELCSIQSGGKTEVMDLNLINNGIHTIMPVSQTNIMLKTGFSSLEDTRINNDSESEALIESVYFGSLSMFISSFRDKTTIGYKLLGTAYYDKGIVSPGVSGDYIYFTVIDYQNRSSETVFYDHVNDETLRCIREDIDTDDISAADVISNTPYMRNVSPDRTTFFNVRTGENDGIFFDEQFASLVGSILVFGCIKHGRRCTRVYRERGSRFILEERGRFLSGCCIGSEHFLYIFSK